MDSSSISGIEDTDIITVTGEPADDSNIVNTQCTYLIAKIEMSKNCEALIKTDNAFKIQIYSEVSAIVCHEGLVYIGNAN